MLDEVRKSLKEIIEKLEGKAGVALVAFVEGRMDKLETRVGIVESSVATSTAVDDKITNLKRWLIVTGITAIGSIGGLIFTILHYAKG
jgi:hypothetical protein